MAILKCKMCGGDIELSADKTFGTCESCGCTMTFPKVDDEQRANAFNRGNHFRRMGEFDKALAVYERIVQEDENDAEAHWCCALCRFGIEYVEDPNTFEYLPTCHRASFDSFLEDVDYLAALEHSDGITRRQYQKDAAKIAEVQRGILATSQNEEPFDVFICYKESENDGSRTRDSLMAQEIYYQLTEQGRRVFFSRITLEDKAGTEYEPYIFAALNSAKVMILVTTSAEHANAVWVKNEWSRFLSLMRKDRTKLLLPCYRDMDPYDLPEALSALQSYDMGKIGFIQDLTRGVNKVLNASKLKETVRQTVVIQQGNANVEPLLERAFMFLEDGEWENADEFFEQVLNLEPKNAEAYLGKLMAEMKVNRREQMKEQSVPFDNRKYYRKAIRFADEKLKKQLTDMIAAINDRIENEHQKMIEESRIAEERRKEEERIAEECIPKQKLNKAMGLLDSGDYEAAYALLEEIGNSDAIASSKYDRAISLIDNGDYEAAYILLDGLDYKDSADRLDSIKPEYQKILLARAEVGSYVFFGSYEQDNDTTNGKEDIEWLVLAKEDNKILVISRYALDCQQYNTSYTSVTWETCSLRRWLNGTFINNAFSSGLQSMIQTTTVTADKNPSYRTSPGNNTTDKVFLLSITEVNQYFSSDSARQCQGTAYCYAQGAYKGSNGNCWWRLRSPGCVSTYAAYVDAGGSFFYGGNRVDDDDDVAVRPALWINLGGN